MRGNSRSRKRDACRYEIEAAIDVYVRFENLVAAHLLIFAAQEIMSVLAKKSFPPTFNYRNHRIGLIPDKTVKEAWDTHFNFFKHGTRDHSATIYLNPMFTEIVILTAINDWVVLFGEATNKMIAYGVLRPQSSRFRDRAIAGDGQDSGRKVSGARRPD